MGFPAHNFMNKQAKDQNQTAPPSAPVQFPLEYKGVIYKTLSAFCRANRVPYGRTRSRMVSGRPVEEWFTDRALGRHMDGIDLGGYPSVKAMADACRVSYTSLYMRLRTGMSAADAMKPKAPRKRSSFVPPGHEVTYKGVAYPSIRAASRALGISFLVVYQRWHRGVRGDSLFTKPSNRKAKPRRKGRGGSSPPKLTRRQPAQGDDADVST